MSYNHSDNCELTCILHYFSVFSQMRIIFIKLKFFSGKILVALGQWNHDQYLNNVGIIEIVDLINPNSKWNGPIEGLIENQSIIYSGYFHNFDKMIQNYDFDRWESSDFVIGSK